MAGDRRAGLETAYAFSKSAFAAMPGAPERGKDMAYVSTDKKIIDDTFYFIYTFIRGHRSSRLEARSGGIERSRL